MTSTFSMVMLALLVASAYAPPKDCQLPFVLYSPELNMGLLWSSNTLDITCSGVGQSIIGPTGVVCNDGTLEWKGPQDPIPPKCYMDECPLPNVDSLGVLDGTNLDHGKTLSNFVCTGGKCLVGPTGVSCDDGTLTWTGTSTKQPECIDFTVDINPAPQLVEVGSTATLTCSSIATPFTVSKVVWSSAGAPVEEDTSPTSTGNTGSVVFTSKLELTGAPELNAKTYKCKMVSGCKEAESTEATVYIVGVKSGVATYPGEYFESDAQTGDFSESGSMKFEVYRGPGIATVSGTMEKKVGAESPSVVLYVTGNEDDNLVPYTYEIADSIKVTGTYQITVTYQDVSGAVGDRIATMDLLLPVYRFCKIDELPTVTGGTWSPATKVDFRGYATLTCESGKYMKGEGIAQCLPGTAKSAFVAVDPTPTCESMEDLLTGCGVLTKPNHGSVIYKDTNTASYSCDAGYFLLGAQTYTCDTATGFWSIVTAANPNGNPPACQAAIAAESRYVEVDFTIKVSAALCPDDDGKLLVSTALKSALEDNEIVKCTKDFYCIWTDFTCTYEKSTESIRVGVKLQQTQSLRDKTLISGDVERLNTKGPEVSFQVTTSNKKRGTETASVTTATATIVTKCSPDSVVMHGACSVCPAGYGLSGSTCSPCVLGQYSIGGTINPCTPCSGGLTTLLAGSRASSDCKAESLVCTVETDVSEHRTLVPPGGARITHDAYVSMTCETGYNLELNVEPTFKCSAKPYPVCYRECSLAKYTEAVLKERFIHEYIGTMKTGPLRHKEKISITCMTGYEYIENTLVKSHICRNGVLPDFGTCIEQSNSTTVGMTVISCVLALCVVILLLFILLQWRKQKQAAKYKVKCTAVVENEYAQPNDSRV